MNAPFYSDKDSTLIKETAVRDYLGVLPVWSKVARGLEPNLAGAIGNYRGMSAVLFIYHLEPKLEQKKQFRVFFRYMELLVEYYLFHESKAGSNYRGPCYGSRLLTSQKDNKALTISPNSNTIANGLYQFYRGTCRRAGMLSDNWIVDSEVTPILEKIELSHLTAANSLVKTIEKLIDNQSAEICPNDVLQTDIKALFASLFSSTDLVEYFKRKLFNDPELAHYAMVCHTQRQAHKDANALTLAQVIQNNIDSKNKAHPALSHVLYCEPFLTAIDSCFQLLHLHDGKQFDVIAKYFDETTIAAAMQEKANEFLKLTENADYQKGRFKSLLGLAERVRNRLFSDFLRELAEYHQQVMKGRNGGDALLLVEGDIVRSIADIGPANEEQITDRLLNKTTTNNGYYIKTTARIYRQLYQPAA
jgi:hypothetical protein